MSKWRNKGQSYHLKSSWGNALPHVDKATRDAYNKWYDSLTAEQLAQLGGRPHASNPTGEVTPILKHHHHLEIRSGYDENDTTIPGGVDITTILSCATQPSEIDDLPDNPTDLPAILVLEIVRKVLHAWTSAPDRSTRLHGEVLGVALGIPGESISTLARKYGCTRQAVSKRHRSIIKALSLPPSVRMVLGQTKAAQVLHRKNIALPTKLKRRKAPTLPSNHG